MLVFCNDDVVLGPGSLRLLHDVLVEHEEAGVVGPDGTLWDLTVPKHLERLDLSGRPAGALEACEVVSGYLFAMRASVWEALGGFDEAYAPCSWEEVDLCTDARLRLGLECYAVAGVEVEHEYGISVSRALEAHPPQRPLGVPALDPRAQRAPLPPQVARAPRGRRPLGGRGPPQRATVPCQARS